MSSRSPKALLFSLFASLLILTNCAAPPAEPDVLTIEYLSSLSEEELRARDSDGDGVSDYDELITYGTDPLNPDTDGDGLNDSAEINQYGTDPLNRDTDGDRLTDGEEVNSYGSDPVNSDTDGDGLFDGDETALYATDPTSADTDNDGLSDGDEALTYGTDPTLPDTDGDEFGDGDEISMGTDPLDPNDPGRLSELQTVYFGFDKSNLSVDAANALTGNIEELQANPNFRVRVDAYTDHVGGDQYNLRLSLRRATAVVEFYRRNGISEDRIDSRGLGKAPVPCLESEKDSDTPGCQRNRRAESIPLNPNDM